MQESNRLSHGTALEAQTVTAVNMELYVFCDTTPYNLVKMYPRYGGTTLFYFQTKGVKQFVFAKHWNICPGPQTSHSADKTYKPFSVSISFIAAVLYRLTFSLVGKWGRQVECLL
jgi:hypothetical protein